MPSTSSTTAGLTTSRIEPGPTSNSSPSTVESTKSICLLTAMGFFLVEIKSRPGRVYGDAGTWTWDTDGRLVTTANLFLTANFKAKKLKQLFFRQKAVKIKDSIPYIEPLIVLSAPNLRMDLRIPLPTASVCGIWKPGAELPCPALEARPLCGSMPVWIEFEPLADGRLLRLAAAASCGAAVPSRAGNLFSWWRHCVLFGWLGGIGRREGAVGRAGSRPRGRTVSRGRLPERPRWFSFSVRSVFFLFRVDFGCRPFDQRVS